MKALPPTKMWRASVSRVIAEHRRHAHGPGAPRHVARLAASLLRGERAVPPLLVVHLLRQRAHDFAVRPHAPGDERVARGAQLGLPDVRRLRLLEAGHRPHDRPAARRRSRYGPKIGRTPSAGGGVTTKSPLNLSRVPRPSGAIWWQTVHETLSAARRCERRVLSAGDRQVREHPALPPAARAMRASSACDTPRTRPGCPPRATDGRWFPDGRRPASTDPAPSWPSSWSARSTPIDTSSPAGDVSLLWQARQSSECAKSDRSIVAAFAVAGADACASRVARRGRHHPGGAGERKPAGAVIDVVLLPELEEATVEPVPQQ